MTGGGPVTKKMKSRIVFVLAAFMLVCFLPIILQLFNLQILRHEEYQARAIDQQVRDTMITPKRGTIYDRNLKALAVSASTETVYIAPKSIRSGDTATRELVALGLSQILDVSYDMLLKKTQANNYYEVVKRQVEQDLADEVRRFITENNLSCIALAEDSKRYYPYGSFAAHVIGFTNIDGDGLEGVEAYYNDILMGLPGRIITLKNAQGVDMPFKYEQYIDARNGYNLVLTIDEGVQHFVEKHLENAVAEYNVENRATAIVMDVNTGEVLAMATYPSYDLNSPRTIADEELVLELESLSGAEYSARQMEIWQSSWRNKAISDTYEPGSVFKIITAAVALEENVVSKAETFSCPGYKVVAGIRISCWRPAGHGVQSLQLGICNSCNPVFMELGARIGGGTFYDYVRAFGFLERTGIDLYGEATGIFHQRSIIERGVVETAVTSFGQTFKVTPLQMIAAISAVVNGGNLVEPRIASKVIDDDGNVIKTFETVVRRQVLSEEVSMAMRTLIENVVADGTGRNAAVKGYRIGGKTGTSEKIDQKNEAGEADKRIASFCGFAPADNPQIAILLILDEPDYPTPSGGIIAAPTVGKMFADILPYMGIMPQYTQAELLSLEKSVPDILGMTVEEARTELRSAGFNPVVMEGGGGEVVMAQMPRAGSKLAAKGKVLIYTKVETSSMAEIPNVAGLSPGVAESILVNAGFNIRISGKDIEDIGVTAASQSPVAGALAEFGAVVEVEFIHNDEAVWQSSGAGG